MLGKVRITNLLLCMALLYFSGCSSVYITSFLSSRPVSSAANETTQALEKRNTHFKLLAKGVNVQGWCVDNKTNILVKKRKFCIQEADVRLIQQMGFTHVRLLVEPGLIMDEKQAGKVNPESLANLKALVKTFIDHKVAVVIDLHPWHVIDPLIKERLAKEDRFIETFSVFWKTLARELSQVSADEVFFEPLNEPFFNEFLKDPIPRWQYVQNRLVKAIRSVAPDNTIIVESHNWGSIEGLFPISPVPDENVIYSVHYYTPIEFTSQGSKWAGEGLKDLHHLPYPVDVFKIQKALPSFPPISQGRARHYQRSLFKSEKLYQDFLPLVQWANQYDLKLYLGEFGVFKKSSYPSDRARWLSDMRTMCERFGMGWSVWDYNQDFSITQENADFTRSEDPVILNALGLRSGIKNDPKADR